MSKTRPWKLKHQTRRGIGLKGSRQEEKLNIPPTSKNFLIKNPKKNPLTLHTRTPVDREIIAQRYENRGMPQTDLRGHAHCCPESVRFPFLACSSSSTPTPKLPLPCHIPPMQGCTDSTFQVKIRPECNSKIVHTD